MTTPPGAEATAIPGTTGPARTRVLGIIPARYGSTRLPGKVLCDIAGRPMIEHVWRRAMRADCLDQVLVATDDVRVAEVCAAFGAQTVMTSKDHANGTDRAAEAARGSGASIVVNIQGDEPLLNPHWINELVAPFHTDRDLPMATLATPFTDPERAQDPHTVKVVMDINGDALYFSRHPIPYDRHHTGITRYQHIGLYAYRADFLTRYTRTTPAPAELAEGLEQLRALHTGHRIKVVTVTGETGTGVDTPHDLERARARFTSSTQPS